MGRKVEIHELSIEAARGVVRVAWRRAPEYPAPLGEALAWEERGAARVDIARSIGWRGGPEGLEEARRLVERFAEEARAGWGDERVHHRVVVPSGDLLDPSVDMLARWIPTLAALLDGPNLVLRALAPEQTSRAPVELGFPIAFDVLVPTSATAAGTPDPERSFSSPFWRRARAEGLVAPRLAFHDMLGVADLREGAVLHAGSIDLRAVLRILRRRHRPPRLLVIEPFPQWDLASVVAAAVVAAGCPAVVICDDPPSDGVGFTEALYPLLLQDLPLDVAVSEAIHATGRPVKALLAAAGGAESTRVVSWALVEHRHLGGRLLDAFADPPEPRRTPRSELGRYLERRRAKAKERARDVARAADALELAPDEGAFAQIEALRGAAHEAVEVWRRLEGEGEGGTRGAESQFERFTDRHAQVLGVGEGNTRSLRDGGDEASAEDRRMPPRLTHVSVTEAGRGAPVPDRACLELGAPYELRIQIRFALRTRRSADEFPLRLLRGAFDERDGVDLDVLVFARDEDVALEARSARLRLQRLGASDEAVVPFVLRPGDGAPTTHRRLRVGIYHKNRLLQSVAVDLAVAEGHATMRAIDYVASDELLLVDELPPVTASLFVNDGPGGTHWIGVAGAESALVIALDPRAIEARVTELRASYDDAQGAREDLYGGALIPDSGNWHRRVAELVRLARAGRKLYFAFFGSNGGLTRAQKARFEADLRRPGGLLEIARCRESAPGLPWSALYDYDLENGVDVTVCEAFLSDLRHNAAGHGPRRDVLDDPERCAARPECPLRGDAPDKHVCPFGFWGIRHRIEQPTHAVPASDAAFEASRAAVAPAPEVQGDASLAVAYWSFQNAKDHLNEVRRLVARHGGEVGEATTRAGLKRLLATERASVIYFYCHGDEVDDVFALRIGDPDAPFMLDGDTLYQWRLPSWEQAPLVVLNGCETLAVSPERVHGFLVVLRDMGASGVIGPEVPVWSGMARRVGESLVARFLGGEPLGRALQAIQRDLLRELNPIGLMYVAYARADLTFKKMPSSQVAGSAYEALE